MFLQLVAKSELFRRDGHFVIELHVSLKKILMFINFTDFVFLVKKNPVLTFKTGTLRSYSDFLKNLSEDAFLVFSTWPDASSCSLITPPFSLLKELLVLW